MTITDLAAGYDRHLVLSGINLTLRRGRCTALLGESGSGKTTLARTIAGLHRPSGGSIEMDSTVVAALARQRPRELLRSIQYIFQNPYESINPRITVREAILRPYHQLGGSESDDDVIARVMEDVRLRPDLANRFPDQLSGGERQRVAVARALTVEPKLLVCDEITSALDVSVQASIVAMLQRLQEEKDLTLLFVTHNMALVRNIAQDVAVLQRGEIVEYGPTETVFTQPKAEYTRQLMADTPSFDVAG